MKLCPIAIFDGSNKAKRADENRLEIVRNLPQ